MGVAEDLVHERLARHPADLVRPDPATVPEYGDGVGVLFDLLQTVRHMNHAHTGCGQPPYRVKQQVGIGVGQRSGRFVEDQAVQVGRAGQVDRPADRKQRPGRDREIPDQRGC